MKQLFIFIIYIFFCYFNGYSQSNSLYFVQFKITTVNTEKEAKTVDNKIARKKGIISTHTDHITSTYFCTIDSDSYYVFDDFTKWFAKLGYQISCFTTGLQGVDGIISPHELKNCEKNNNN